MLEEVDHQMQKAAGRLEKVEQGFEDLQQYFMKKAGGSISPVSKTMNFSFSMVSVCDQASQISNSLQDSINRFEQRLAMAKIELESLNQNVNLNLYSEDEGDNESDCLEAIDNDGRPGLIDKRLMSSSKKTKNKFTASRDDAPRKDPVKPPESLDKEIEELFFKIEKRHGMSSSSVEIKLAAQRILQGEPFVFVKANIGSNHHLLYDAIAFSQKKAGVLFLNPALEPSMRKVFHKNVTALTIDSLQTVADIDVLFVEQCELIEDLPVVEFAKLRDCLKQKPFVKVLLSGFMTYRAFTDLKRTIQQPFPEIEHIKITSSREESKVQAVKILLKQAALSLDPDSMILILTESQSEANKLWATLNSNGEIGRYMKLNNIQFGPLGNPPLAQVFSLVVYYSMPRKIEQLLAQITLLNNNYIYQNYGKLRKLNVTHFHLIAESSDFVRGRQQVFTNAVSELQTERFFKALLAKHIENVQAQSTAKTTMTLKELTRMTHLQNAGINRIVRHLQSEGLVRVGIRMPCKFNFKPTTTGLADPIVQKLVLQAKEVITFYSVSLAKAAEVFGCQLSEVLLRLRALMAEELLTFETDDELIEMTPSETLLANSNDLAKSAYMTLRSQNILESRLLQYIYLILRIGSTPTEQVFTATQCNKNMVSLLKNYAVAEEASIRNLFPENAVRDAIEPVKGDENQLQQADLAFRQLLYRVEDFFPQELALCKDQEKGTAAREFVRLQMVRTLLELPGAYRLKARPGWRPGQGQFQGIDFESLLSRSDLVLAEYVSKAR